MPATVYFANKLRDYVSTGAVKLGVGKLNSDNPTTTSLSLQHELIRITQTSVDTGTDNEVTFQYVLTASQGNGKPLKEIGQFFTAVTQLEDGEDVSDWSAGGDAALSADATIYEVGTKSMKMAITQNTGTSTATKTTSIGDISAITGSSTGTPTNGQIRILMYPDGLANISGATFRLGSDSSNYASEALTIGDLTDESWYSWNIDMKGMDITGTPNWAAVDYQHIIVETTDSADIYFDDMFVSEDAATRSAVPTVNKTNLYEIIYEVTNTVTPQ